MSLDNNVSAESSAPTSHRTSARGGRILRFVEAYALLIVMFGVIAFFSLWPTTAEVYPTMANLQIIIAGQSVLAIVAVGALMPLICNEWDLSVGASATLSAVVAASLLSSSIAVPFALAIGLGTGVVVGLVNGFLVNFLGTNAVITTLGTTAVIAGVINQVTGGSTQVSNIPTFLTEFGSGTWLGIPRLFYVVILVAAAGHYLLEYTPTGRHFYAIGSNRNAAVLIGVNIRKTIGIAFLIAGVLAGLAGLMQVARSGAADPRLGDSLTLPALAAAFLSAAAIKPGRYNVPGMLVALFLLAFINSGLTIAGVPPYVSQYVNGIALIAGVGLAVNLGRKREVV
jgi:ribose transport system permease protein